jgi:anti-sigma-K factor RskA
MAGPEDERDPDLDAAERALGILPRDGEGLDGARRRREWEMRLAPLAGLVAPVPPPEGLLPRILGRIGEDDKAGALALERKRAARWRGAALAMGLAAAAAIAVAIVLPREAGPGPELVSIATGDAGAPALVVSLDPETGAAIVRPVALEQPADGDYELWHIPVGGAPVSLGLVDPASAMQVALNAAPGDLVAVSLEPAGGSPTGQPTGPVLYSGSFVTLR